MSYYNRQQPSSKLESHPSEWESLTLWSTNDSSSRLTHLIEREALSTHVPSPVINTSTKPSLLLVIGLNLCLMGYSLGLILLSQNLHSLTRQVVLEWISNYRTLEQI